MGMVSSSTDIEHITRLDRDLVTIIRDFLILGPLSWSMEVQQSFLTSVKRGNLILPKVEYPKVEYKDKIERLEAFLKRLGKDDHPAIAFLRDNAESYLLAYRILQGIGTSAVSEYSRALYGYPGEVLPNYKRKNIEVASYFLRVANKYKVGDVEEEQNYSAKQLRQLLKHRLKDAINVKADPITISIDPTITARATAGPNYVKLRANARFSDADLHQLMHHEVFTHTLTYINGRKQPVLSSMGYSAPRITGTQEGLATFSEYVNFAIDLVRLRRIALRIVALDMAEQGADLIDLFRFFRKNGQENEESYYSAMRIFRGGFPQGGIIFYKDNVYLRGLIEVEGFLKGAMHRGMLNEMDILFAGKMTTADVMRLHPLIQEGHVILPTYMPKWMTQRQELAAHLAFNDLTERFKLKPGK